MKDKIIRIRISSEDKKKIKDSGIKYSDVFYYGLKGYSKERETESIRLLKNIANNLNQLSKHCNQTGQAPIKKDIEDIKREINKCISDF